MFHVCRAPLGSPDVPEVNSTRAIRSGSSRASSSATGWRCSQAVSSKKEANAISSGSISCGPAAPRITRWRSCGNRGAISRGAAAWSKSAHRSTVTHIRAPSRASTRSSSRGRIEVITGASTAPTRAAASNNAAACQLFGNCSATTSPGSTPSSHNAPANRST